MIAPDLTDLLIDLLCQLIRTPSFSREEHQTAHLLEAFLTQQGVKPQRLMNNVWAVNSHFDPAKPTILLNSHHDTVRPNPGWQQDPFQPTLAEDRLTGLGSNDAGASLIALMGTFLHFFHYPNLAYNLVLAATAEEEISGPNGIALLWPQLPPIAFAIVGEPTGMQMAVAEKGLMVLDCTAIGLSGHAAREEGDNAILKAIRDIEWFHTFRFPKISPTLGPVKMNVTIIQAGTQHNVIPATCQFTVDVRTTDSYTNEETLALIRSQVNCQVQPRSTRLNPSGIPLTHPLVQAGLRLGLTTFGSPTLSDQALIPCPSLKMGPGLSERSHTAQEFIFLEEIRQGIAIYTQLLQEILC